MVDWEFLRNIAVIITLIGAALTILKKFVWSWVKQHLIWTDLQKPHEPVKKERLSWLDAGNGINILLPEVEEFDPDNIFGINRGGAIVGAIIGKKLKLPPPIILYIDPENSYAVIEQKDASIQIGKKILLVDDYLDTGSHMKSAIQYLNKHYGDRDLKKMVLLRVDRKGKGGPAKPEIPDVEKAFFTHGTEKRLPWDP